MRTRTEKSSTRDNVLQVGDSGGLMFWCGVASSCGCDSGQALSFGYSSHVERGPGWSSIAVCESAGGMALGSGCGYSKRLGCYGFSEERGIQLIL